MAERAATSAAAIVVPTVAVAGELAPHLRPTCPVVVIGQGVSGRLALPADADARAARLGLPDGPYLLSMATLEPRKALDVLITALARTEAPDVPLLLAGQAGWGGVNPLRYATDAGLPAERIRLMGHVADADLAVALDRATALVMPSRAEGFGLPVLEAMAAGTAVVSSDAPALVEVGGGATCVTPVGDADALAAALARVVGDDGYRAGLRTAGLRRAEDFSWLRTADRMWELYRELEGAR
jgi:glycosyltransferase involved in cell wall biosynthesis